MMLRACVNARASSGTRSAFCPRYAIQRRRMWETSGRVTRPTPYMPLCTRSEVYIGLVCPGIGLSHGAADDARRQGAGQVSQLTAGSDEGLWVGLTARQECLLVSYRPLDRSRGRAWVRVGAWNSLYLNEIPTPGPLAIVRLGLKRASAGHNRLTNHNQSNFLLQGSARSPA